MSTKTVSKTESKKGASKPSSRSGSIERVKRLSNRIRGVKSDLLPMDNLGIPLEGPKKLISTEAKAHDQVLAQISMDDQSTLVDPGLSETVVARKDSSSDSTLNPMPLAPDMEAIVSVLELSGNLQTRPDPPVSRSLQVPEPGVNHLISSDHPYDVPKGLLKDMSELEGGEAVNAPEIGDRSRDFSAALESHGGVEAKTPPAPLMGLTLTPGERGARTSEAEALSSSPLTKSRVYPLVEASKQAIQEFRDSLGGLSISTQEMDERVSALKDSLKLAMDTQPSSEFHTAGSQSQLDTEEIQPLAESDQGGSQQPSGAGPNLGPQVLPTTLEATSKSGVGKGGEEPEDPVICEICNKNLATQGRLCDRCSKEDLESTDAAGGGEGQGDPSKTPPADPPVIKPSVASQIREDIYLSKFSAQAQALDAGMRRSQTVLLELKLLHNVLQLLGGANGPESLNRSRLAIHNLRQPDVSMNQRTGPPVVKVLGLREAIQLIDQVKDFPFTEVAVYHTYVLGRRVAPRKIDGVSVEVLQDEVLQAWFGRIYVLKRLLTDPLFLDWVFKPGVQIGDQVIKKGVSIEQRMEFLEECCDTMIQLFTAFSAQSGIRGPAQVWDHRAGLHRPPEIPLEASVTPCLLWNMRLLEDCAFFKEQRGLGWPKEGYNIHRLRSILFSTMTAFQIIVDKVTSSQNGDLHHAFLAIAMEVDGLRGQPQDRRGHWSDFHSLVVPWVSRENWLKMEEELHRWHDELHCTSEFLKRIHPPSPGPIPNLFLKKDLPKVKDLNVRFEQQASESSFKRPILMDLVDTSTPRRGTVGSDSRYRRSDQSPARIDPSTKVYVEAIREVLIPHAEKRSRSEEQEAYLKGIEFSRDKEAYGSQGREGAKDWSRQNGASERSTSERGRRDDPDRANLGRPSRSQSGGSPGGDPPPWRPPGGGGGSDGDPDDDDDDDEKDRQGNGTGNNSSRKKLLLRCEVCDEPGHRRGDRLCPLRQKYCMLCQTNSHDYQDCHLRSDAPKCELCGSSAHGDPRQCPILVAEEKRRARDLLHSDPNMSYANWKAKMDMGSDLKGRFPQEADITINSEYKNEVERRRKEEERREREELKRTELHQANLTRTLQKASIEAHEVTKQMTSSQLAQLPPGSELPQKSKDHIEKAGTTVFLNHLGTLSRPGNNPMKDVSLEDLGFGKDVTFSGDNRGLSIKQFLKQFDEAKDSRQWDDTVSAKLISGRFRGPAKVWYDNLTLDASTKTDAAFYSTLKGHLIKRFQRKRDWVDKNSLFRQVRWDKNLYRGSHLSFWEDTQNAALRFMEDFDPRDTFTVKQVQDFLTSNHFFSQARDEVTTFLLERGVEDDPAGIKRELQRKEDIMMRTQRKPPFPGRSEMFRRDRFRSINALEAQSDQSERTPLQLYWDEVDQDLEERALEIEALKKNNLDATGEEDSKICWVCHRPGHIKANCPDLKDLERTRGRRPGEDGRFKDSQVPGYESDALRRNWTGPRTVPQKRTESTRPRGRYTPLKRAAGSKKPTSVQRNRTYQSRRSKNTYRVAALGASFLGEDEEIIGQLERILIAGEPGEEVFEELEGDLQVIYDPSEIAEISQVKPSVHVNPGSVDHPEVASVARPISLNEVEGSFKEDSNHEKEEGGYIPFRF